MYYFHKMQMYSAGKHSKLSSNKLNKFRILVRKALFLTPEEENLFYSISEDIWQHIFDKNFNSDLSYAERVILNPVEDSNIKHTETRYLERVKENIDNFNISADLLEYFIEHNKPVIFITDFDNDGSLSQSVIMQLYKVLPEEKHKNIHLEYARSVADNKTRGFTFDLVKQIVKNKNIDANNDFLIVTADNGINSRSEQIKINKHFPYATLLVTDHHNPDPDLMVLENENTIIFNPHYFKADFDKNINISKETQESYDFFRKYNISGASTVGLLIKRFIQNHTRSMKENLSLMEQMELMKTGKGLFDNELKSIDKLSKMSNMLDYVETHPADKPTHISEIEYANNLQSLLNTNNSLSAIITGNIEVEKLHLLSQQNDEVNVDKIITEIKNIHFLNVLSKGLLDKYNEYRNLDISNTNDDLVLTWLEDIVSNSREVIDSFDINENTNYIEQLRPFIFALSFNQEKKVWEDQVLNSFLDIYKKLRKSERGIIDELRKTELTDAYETDYANIYMVKPDFQHLFNRKLIHKTYNRLNVGVNIVLDNYQDGLLSGSFRSIVDVSDFFNQNLKEKIEKQYQIKISTPGHERAAGFIIEGKIDNVPEFLTALSHELNNSISLYIANNTALKQNNDLAVVSDLGSLETIGRINKVIRGNVSHMAKIKPLIRLNPEDNVYVDRRNGLQTNLLEKSEEQKYGYTSVNTKLETKHQSGENVIIPNFLIKKLSENNFENYLRFDYLNNGVFIAENEAIIDLNNSPLLTLSANDERKEALADFFEKNNKGQNIVTLNREDIQNNPFFQKGKFTNEQDFLNFEKFIIGVLDKSNTDCYSVFDVEADGFGNAKLLNIGFMNYFIDEGNAEILDPSKTLILKSLRNDYFHADKSNTKLKEIGAEEFYDLKQNSSQNLFESVESKFYIAEQDADLIPVSNIKEQADGKYMINRHIKGESFSFLVKPKGFSIPSAIEKLTGITNDMAHRYGLPLEFIDEFCADYFKDKSTLFIAHNTEYDARICRINLPVFDKVLHNPQNIVSDSAEFSKEHRLMYDNIPIVSVQNVPELNGLYFYNNTYSPTHFEQFVASNEEGVFPDVKNRKHIVKKKRLAGGYDFYVNDLSNNNLTKINMDNFADVIEHDAQNIFKKTQSKNPIMIYSGLNSQHVGYKAQGLGEVKQIRQMLSSKDKEITFVKDVESKYPFIAKEQALEFQNFYRLNKTGKENVVDFLNLYGLSKEDENNIDKYRNLLELSSEFEELNAHLIEETWIYQTVLNTFEPQLKTDINKDQIDLISYQTAIKPELVEQVLNDVYNFKKEYGIDRIIVDEHHCNGPVTGKLVGDIAYEDKATVLLLIDRFANGFGDGMETTVNYFIDVAKQYGVKFSKQFALADDIAVDSASYSQIGFHYDNSNNHSSVTESVNERKTMINEGDSEQIIKLKMSEDLIQNGKHVYMIKRKNTYLTDEDIDNDKRKLEFIIGTATLSLTSKNGFEYIYDNNLKQALQYKKELQERYCYIEINNAEDMLNKYIKDINEYLNADLSFEKLSDSNSINPAKRANANSGVDSISMKNIQNVEEILFKQIVSLMHSIPDENIKQDIKQISQNYTKQNFDNMEFASELGGEINNVLNYFHDLKVKSVEYMEEKYGVSNLYNNTHIRNITISSEFLNDVSNISTTLLSTAELQKHSDFIEPVIKLVKAYYMNTLAINQKLHHPCRLEQVLQDIRNNRFVEDVLQDELETDNFLSAKHSRITRNNVSKHLFEKMDFTKYLLNTVFPEEEIKVKQVQKLKPSF